MMKRRESRRDSPILTPQMAREHPANRAKLAIPTGS